MTGDDTKVDTSGPAIPDGIDEWLPHHDKNYTGPSYSIVRPTPEGIHLGAKGYGTIGCFYSREARNACLLAVQSLPKVTAERDELAADLERFKNMYCNAFSDRSLLRLEVSALSALVRDLKDGIAYAVPILENSSVINDRSALARFRALLERGPA